VLAVLRAFSIILRGMLHARNWKDIFISILGKRDSAIFFGETRSRLYFRRENFDRDVLRKNYDFSLNFLSARSISHNLRNPLLKYGQITLEHAMHCLMRAVQLLVRIFKRFSWEAHHFLLVCSTLSNLHCQKLRCPTLYGALYIKFHDLISALFYELLSRNGAKLRFEVQLSDAFGRSRSLWSNVYDVLFNLC